MNKIEEIKARWGTPRLGETLRKIADGAYIDIPYLLSEVDRLTELTQHLGNCEDCHSEHDVTMGCIKTDRDHWKARAEALENAIRKECFYCNHNACKLPCGCINFSGWQFDQEQFTDKSIPCQDEETRKCDRCGKTFFPVNQLCICETCDSELEIQCQNMNKTNF